MIKSLMMTTLLALPTIISVPPHMTGLKPITGHSSSSAAWQHSAAQTRNEIRIENRAGHHEWVWRHSDGQTSLEVKINGEVKFTDDYSDIRSLSPNGFVRIEERRGSTLRRYEVRPDAAGALRRAYFVDNEARSVDAEAKTWVARLMLELVRQSAFDAPARVQKILKASGPDAVLEEITLIKSDHAKRRYFEELLMGSTLNQAVLQRAMNQMAREIKSDYEQAQLLTRIAQDDLAPEVLPSFFAAVGTIKSDYEKGRVLAAVLKKESRDKEVLLATLKSAEGISSDYEKAQVLTKAAEMYKDNGAVRAAYFAAVNTINSDYEHGRVLAALLKRSGVSEETLIELLKSTANIASDYEKARVLLQVAAATSSDEALRRALLDAAKTINSDYERERVLSAVIYKDGRQR